MTRRRAKHQQTEQSPFDALLQPRNFVLFVISFALFGLIWIFDASVPESLQSFGVPWHYALRHSLWLIIGSIIFITVSFIPWQWWKKLSPYIFAVAVILLLIVLVPGIGARLQGARRWILLGPVPIQPSEITKLALILFQSSWLAKHQRFGPFLFFTGVVTILILLQPDLSTAAILLLVSTVLYFVAGGQLKPLIIFGSLAIPTVLFLILIAPYRRERLLTFINPASDPLGKSYHIRQITLALGRGGLLGQGIGLSKQKQHYIPEAANDSIFAIYAEELGFAGSLLLFSLYLLLIRTGLQTAKRQSEPFPFLVASGITSWIGIQTIINLSAMVALIPLTGVPLPLMSYGGSALISNMAGLGILLGLLRQNNGAHNRLRSKRRVVNKL